MRSHGRPNYQVELILCCTDPRDRYYDWMHDRESIQSLSFSGHESFPLRFAWLTKAVREVEKDPSIFSSDDAIVRLGVGKNMVRSIRHWANRVGVIEIDGNKRGGRYRVTKIGSTIFGPQGLDPYLEDPATVWYVHWRLCSSPETSPTTWYWVFNQLRRNTFEQAEIIQELLRLAEGYPGKVPSDSTLYRDLACFVRTYIPAEPDRKISREETYDSPLTELRLLRKEPESSKFVLERSSRHGLTASFFSFALCEFWQAVSPRADTISFEQVTYQPGSPGQVFRITENFCVQMLESLHEVTSGAVSFDSTAGIRQVIRHKKLPKPEDLLFQHYEEAYCASNL